VEIVTWRVYALCALRQPKLANARPERSARRVADHRMAYFPGPGLIETPVRTHEELPVGQKLIGPLIVESPVTTVVLDERAAVERAASGSLKIDPFAVSSYSRRPSAETNG
jgi:N-methylhydantoinase A